MIFGMKKITISFLFALSTLGIAVSQDSGARDLFLKVGFGQAADLLFTEARILIEKLGSLKETDIIYVSSRLQGEQKNKFSLPDASKYILYGVPQMIMLSNLDTSKEFEGDFLICNIYPYKDFLGGGIGETKEPGWIQGRKRFDMWSNRTGLWKVVLDVDISNLKDAVTNFEKTITFCDTVEEVIIVSKRTVKAVRETDEALETQILKKFKK
jgi:hypothetical protein